VNKWLLNQAFSVKVNGVDQLITPTMSQISSGAPPLSAGSNGSENASVSWDSAVVGTHISDTTVLSRQGYSAGRDGLFSDASRMRIRSLVVIGNHGRKYTSWKTPSSQCISTFPRWHFTLSGHSQPTVALHRSLHLKHIPPNARLAVFLCRIDGENDDSDLTSHGTLSQGSIAPPRGNLAPSRSVGLSSKFFSSSSTQPSTSSSIAASLMMRKRGKKSKETLKSNGLPASFQETVVAYGTIPLINLDGSILQGDILLRMLSLKHILSAMPSVEDDEDEEAGNDDWADEEPSILGSSRSVSGNLVGNDDKNKRKNKKKNKKLQKKLKSEAKRSQKVGSDMASWLELAYLGNVREDSAQVIHHSSSSSGSKSGTAMGESMGWPLPDIFSFVVNKPPTATMSLKASTYPLKSNTISLHLSFPKYNRPAFCQLHLQDLNDIGKVIAKARISKQGLSRFGGHQRLRSSSETNLERLANTGSNRYLLR